MVRFGARVAQPGILETIISVLAKIHEESIIVLTLKGWEFRVAEPAQGCQLYARILVDAVFEKFQLQSRDQTICLSVSLVSLLKALKTCRGAETVNVALGKEDGVPVLRWGIIKGDNVKLIQSVPVKLESRKKIEATQEPNFPFEKSVRVRLPDPKKLKTGLERMNRVSSFQRDSFTF
jgi:hypothetical protein